MIEQTTIVTRCFHGCPFFTVDMNNMWCSHPYFDDKHVYDSCIITHENSHTRVPDECPLKEHQVHSRTMLEPITMVKLEDENV